jgi:hypothetical protein
VTLYLDLDGVFADFDLAVFRHTGKWPHELDDKVMWERLDQIPGFYVDLPPCFGSAMLWEALGGYGPVFLSGVPMPHGHMVTAPQDKRAWVSCMFGEEVPLITCSSHEKAAHCQPGDILVDDRDHYAQRWTDAGGRFVHHDMMDPLRTVRVVSRLLGRTA